MNVILIAALSVDGKIAERERQISLDWTSKEDTQFFVSKTKEAGTVIMGHRTFETIGKPLKGRRLLVMTSKARPPIGTTQEEGIVEFTNESPKKLLARLSQEGCSAVIVAGGASVYSAFLREGLVQELFLTIEPVLFGNGIPLMRDVDRINLKLIDYQCLNGQSVLLHYRII